MGYSEQIVRAILLASSPVTQIKLTLLFWGKNAYFKVNKTTLTAKIHGLCSGAQSPEWGQKSFSGLSTCHGLAFCINKKWRKIITSEIIN